ncbi:MAG: hypothetical protein ACLP05_10065 [Candidatus Kryptoniota bacterium]
MNDSKQLFSQESHDVSISYEAQLASMYLMHISDKGIVMNPDAKNCDYVFKQIADQLEQKILAVQSDKNVTTNK